MLGYLNLKENLCSKPLLVDIDECASSPCQNGANCTDIVNGHTCSCMDGYDGANCENGNDKTLLQMSDRY